ncbi:MAG: hypothetical protein H6733_11765 [Alphaproteobacteria bacterium]|nr:hypothetical protein [Alphaproteobacteria bacterium]
MRATLLILVLTACGPGGDAPSDDTDTDAALPLGIPTSGDGDTRAGVAVVDLTPVVTETFDDVNGNHLFDGCFDQPAGGTPDCPEGWDDVDADGVFDAVFIGGFSPLRPAEAVHDPITARAIVLEDGGDYVAFVVLDLVGLASPRIEDAADLLAADGFDRDHLVVLSTHNHQGPDTMGLWGNPEACLLPGDPDCVKGFDAVYQERVSAGIADAVRQAAASMVAVDLRVGRVAMRDRSPLFNGSVWGGHNPTAKMHGMVHDIRDPVIVSDQLLAIQATHRDDDAAGDVLFTWTSWSGHPEVRGGDNNALSADWVGVARSVLEDHYGGVAVHMPESLGGMQSALGGSLPLVDESGAHVLKTCTQDDVDGPTEGCTGKTVGEVATYDDGVQVPVWAEQDSWDFVRSHGWHIAEAAIAALDAGETTHATPLRVMAEDGWVPVRNVAYTLLGPRGIFDLGLDEGTKDTDVCPQAGEVTLGCLPFRVFRVQLGPVGFASAPGELLPELSWGLPTDDPQWVTEAADPTARGPGSRYFPQHDPDCDDVPFDDCREAFTVGDCDCLSLHAWPYVLSDDDPALHPVLDDLDTPYKAAISMTSTYLSYILPEPSVNHAVSLLTDDGDHYEDTVTPAWDFGTLYLQTWNRLVDRWDAASP